MTVVVVLSLGAAVAAAAVWVLAREWGAVAREWDDIEQAWRDLAAATAEHYRLAERASAEMIERTRR
jgi:hypothetical protein